MGSDVLVPVVAVMARADGVFLAVAETLNPISPLQKAWKQLLEIPFNSKNKVCRIPSLLTD